MHSLRAAATTALVLTTLTVVSFALAGCASDSATPTASSTPTITAEPSKTPYPTIPAPTQTDAEAWAEGVIPDNATGGADWSTRVVAVLEPGSEPIITTPAGESLMTVVVACQTEDGSSIAYTNTSDIGEVTTGTVECTTDGTPGAAHDITDVTSGATIELVATASGFIAYSMYAMPGDGGAR